MDDQRHITKEELMFAVESGVKKYINGKIDKLTENVCALSDSFDKHCKLVEPIIMQYNDRKGFWNTISSSSKGVGSLVALIAGMAFLINLLMK